MFPAYGSTTRRPASLHRVLTGRVPLLRRYYQDATTPCRSSRRTSFPSFGGTADGRLRFRSHRRQATNTCDAGHIDHPVCPHVPGFRAETTGPPTFLGNPIVPMPCSPTPAGPITPGHSRCVGTAPVHTTTKAPAGISLEAQSHGLGTRCLRFAGWITPPPRKTRFRLLAKLYRTGLLPVGFQRKVSERSTWLILPSQASWRKVRDQNGGAQSLSEPRP